MYAICITIEHFGMVVNVESALNQIRTAVIRTGLVMGIPKVAHGGLLGSGLAIVIH